jgi:hypothetical protein
MLRQQTKSIAINMAVLLTLECHEIISCQKVEHAGGPVHEQNTGFCSSEK